MALGSLTWTEGGLVPSPPSPGTPRVTDFLGTLAFSVFVCEREQGCLCLCVCEHTWAYVWMRARGCVCIRVYVHECTCGCVPVCVHAVFTCVHVCAQGSWRGGGGGVVLCPVGLGFAGTRPSQSLGVGRPKLRRAGAFVKVPELVSAGLASGE